MDIKLLIVSAPIGAFIITFYLTPFIKKLAFSLGLLDLPEKRKVHGHPTPRIGGLGLFLGIFIGCLFLANHDATIIPILIGAFLIFMVGIIDDIYGMSAYKKLAFQLLIASLSYFMGIKIHWITSPVGGFIFLKWLSFPLTTLWIVGMVNALNLLDGLDGLAAGTTGISATMLSIVALSTQQYTAACLSLIILGSSLGFLRHNFSPAKIFMGDSGAMLLGYLLACTSIIGIMKSTATLSLLVPILMLGLPISDTLFSIFRRIKNQQGIFQADLDHFHHRLLKQGLSAKQISLGFYLLSFLLGVFAILISFSTGITSYIILGAFVIFTTIVGFLFKKKSSLLRSLFNFFL